MRTSLTLGLVLAGAALSGLPAAAQLRAQKLVVMAGPQSPAASAANADAVVVGKVTEVENDPVEATAYPGAPKDQKVSYKVAVIKIDESLLGAGGVTRFRVGFPADAPVAGEAPAGGAGRPAPVGGPGGLGRLRRPGPTAVALAAGMEGCFFLTRHHDADFDILVGGPLLKKNDNYAKELEQVKKVTKAIDDPVAALKAKDVPDRFWAAQVILQRYQTPRGQKPGHTPAREPIPDDETKLIVALLKELPWAPKTPVAGPGEQPPSRSALWYQINPAELGFKQPTVPARKAGDPPVDFNKIMDEATEKFLTENGDKLKIKRFASK
jgi:hypothetical protein